MRLPVPAELFGLQFATGAETLSLVLLISHEPRFAKIGNPHGGRSRRQKYRSANTVCLVPRFPINGLGFCHSLAQTRQTSEMTVKLKEMAYTAARKWRIMLSAIRACSSSQYKHSVGFFNEDKLTWNPKAMTFLCGTENAP